MKESPPYKWDPRKNLKKNKTRPMEKAKDERLSVAPASRRHVNKGLVHTTSRNPLSKPTESKSRSDVSRQLVDAASSQIPEIPPSTRVVRFRFRSIQTVIDVDEESKDATPLSRSPSEGAPLNRLGETTSPVGTTEDVVLHKNGPSTDRNLTVANLETVAHSPQVEALKRNDEKEVEEWNPLNYVPSSPTYGSDSPDVSPGSPLSAPACTPLSRAPSWSAPLNLLGDTTSWDGTTEDVVLDKDRYSLGLSIVGGADHSSHPFGPGVYILKIAANSPAARCQRLRIGDRILAVNEKDVGHADHVGVVEELKRSGAKVKLRIRHEPQPQGLFQTTIVRTEGQPLGISIHGGVRNPPANPNDKTDEGVFIDKVETGSASEIAGLVAGLRIVEVNGQFLFGRTEAELVTIFSKANELRVLVCDGYDTQDDAHKVKKFASSPEPASNESAQEAELAKMMNLDALWDKKMCDNSTPSVSNTVSNDELESVIADYSSFVQKFKFDKARELVDVFRCKRLQASQGARETAWIALFTAFYQIATADRSYFQLQFRFPKAFFRKEPLLQNHYTQIGEDLRKASKEVEKGSLVEHLMIQCKDYVSARKMLIQIYTQLANSPDDWEEMCSLSDTAHQEHKKFQHRVLGQLADVYTTETDILRLLIRAQCYIVDGQMTQTLVKLKEVKDRYDFWVESIDQELSTNNGFLSLFKQQAEKPSQKNRLVQWLGYFHAHLMSKFTMLYGDILGPYCNPSDAVAVTKFNHTLPDSPNYLGLCKDFKGKRHDILHLYVIMNRMNRDDPFYGFQYNRLETRYDPEHSPEPLKGLLEKFPIMMRLPTNWEPNTNPTQGYHKPDMYHAEIANFITGVSGRKVFYDQNIDKLLMCERIEEEIYMVAILEVSKGSRTYNDPGIASFLNDMAMLLRGHRLFQNLKQSSK